MIKPRLEFKRHYLVLTLLALSAATHLFGLSTPREVVFDEVHFGKFVTAYCCTHERFFDIHPPHAKLLIAGAAYLTGFRGGMPFDHIGEPYGEVSPLVLRLFPALTGILLPAVFFMLLAQLGARPAAALAGGFIVLLDNALLVQTRLVSLDGLLLLAIFASLLAALKLPAVIARGDRRWGYYSLAIGALVGLALGVKFTGLVSPALLGLLWAWELLRSRSARQVRRWLLVGLIAGTAAALVYLGGWALHFSLLTQPGSGDAWRVPDFEGNLVINFWRETRELHRLMLDANYNLTAGHPDASRWWEWPLLKTTVFYWQHAGTDGQAGGIYLLGNPFVWWGSTVLLLVIIFTFISDTIRQPAFSWSALLPRSALVIPILGYLISYVPLMRVPRALFLYHYLTPLLFAWLIIILWLDQSGYFRSGGLSRQRASYFGALVVLVGLFFYFSPLTYGFTITPEHYDNLFWLETWR